MQLYLCNHNACMVGRLILPLVAQLSGIMEATATAWQVDPMTPEFTNSLKSCTPDPCNNVQHVQPHSRIVRGGAAQPVRRLGRSRPPSRVLGHLHDQHSEQLLTADARGNNLAART